MLINKKTGDQVAKAFTRSNGKYKFDGLVAGDYIVRQSNLPNFGDVDDADDGNLNKIDVTIGNGSPLDATGRDFVDERLQCIEGVVREDTDNDDKGEEGVRDVVIRLRSERGKVISTTDTQKNGKFKFCSVPPGEYTLVEEVPDGFVEVTDSDAGNPTSIDVEVTDGDSTDHIFVIERLLCIKGSVEEDTDDDDRGEKAVSGVTIKLRNNRGKETKTTDTRGSGKYEFCGLAPGDYSVVEEVPKGFEEVTDSDGGNPTVINVELADGDSTDNDFVIERVRRCIRGSVFEDTDDDNKGEKAVSGVVVRLRDDDGEVIATTSTRDNGNYEFCKLAPGKYSVKEEVPSGFDEVKDSDGGSPTTINVDVGASDKNDNDFVIERKRRCIRGSVREDTDDDDRGEQGVRGVVVRLRDARGDVIATTSTQGNGSYEFCNLAPDDYSVVERVPNDFVEVNDSDGGNPTVITVDLGNNDSNNNDFVIEKIRRCIKGSVREDTDNDNKGEEGVQNVVVKLRNERSDVIGETSTKGNGSYEFCNLLPGKYSVKEEVPKGYDEVTDSDGGNPSVINVDVTDGDSKNNDFVIERKRCIKGSVREDTDNDDRGEDAVSGVLIRLRDDDGDVIATT